MNHDDMSKYFALLKSLWQAALIPFDGQGNEEEQSIWLFSKYESIDEIVEAPSEDFSIWFAKSVFHWNMYLCIRSKVIEQGSTQLCSLRPRHVLPFLEDNNKVDDKRTNTIISEVISAVQQIE